MDRTNTGQLMFFELVGAFCLNCSVGAGDDYRPLMKEICQKKPYRAAPLEHEHVDLASAWRGNAGASSSQRSNVKIARAAHRYRNRSRSRRNNCQRLLGSCATIFVMMGSGGRIPLAAPFKPLKSRRAWPFGVGIPGKPPGSRAALLFRQARARK